MASGNSVISNARKDSDLGILIDKVGIRVDPKDKFGFICAIEKLSKDEKYRLDLGHKARKIAYENFRKEIILNNFEKSITKFTSGEKNLSL